VLLFALRVLGLPELRPIVVVLLVIVIIVVVIVVVLVVVLVDEHGFDHIDVLLGRVVVGERHRHREDAPVVGGVDVVLVGARGSDTVRTKDPYENSECPLDSLVCVRSALIVSWPSRTVTSTSSVGSTTGSSARTS
jgi:hypothetical protein